jgi:GAF domain-containing protein
VSSEGQADLAGLQKALLDTETPQQFLHELAVLAARTVSDGLSCGMALQYRGSRQATATAGSDQVAADADAAQLEAGDGPAVHALRTVAPAGVDDTAADQRWPRFSRQAAALGIGSCYAVPLVSDGVAVGALALYARKPGAFGDVETGRADELARHASGALTLSLRMASCADQNEQLRSSIVSRAVIDQALGVIMATEHCPQDRAFAMLRSVSQNTNVKLRDLATTIVTNVSGEPPKLAAPFEDG